MRNILVEILCPKCFYHTHIKSHTLALPEIEPKLRERILQDRMFSYECPRCHEQITFIHDFLYHDVNRHRMIYMSKEFTELSRLQEQFPQSSMYCVDHPRSLHEKIQILEDGFDDEVICLIKDKLTKQDRLVKDIWYHDYDCESETIWFLYIYEDQEVVKAIERQTYEMMKKNLALMKGVPYE